MSLCNRFATRLPKLIAKPPLRSQLMRSTSQRLYHSYEHAAPPLPYTPAENAILSAALKHVPTQGFTSTSLAMGAREAGYLDITTNLFPGGAFDLVKFHLVSERRNLADNIQFPEADGRPLGVGLKIRALCQTRLKQNEPIIHRWQEALAVMSLMSNVKPSLSELFNLADEIWFLAGDKSVDTTWYTKRATLAGVYASTELFMTQDKSIGFNHTWSFLDRRLTDVYKIGSASSSVAQFFDYTAHSFTNVLRSKGVRI